MIKSYLETNHKLVMTHGGIHATSERKQFLASKILRSRIQQLLLRNLD